MKPTRGMVGIFGRCSRGINKIALCAEDSFFSRLCIKESDKLLSEFVFFLREEGDWNVVKCPQIVQREHHITQNDISQHKDSVAKYSQIAQHKDYVAQTGILQHQDVAKSDDIVQRECHVAQYHLRLISQIKNVLKLLEILKHLGLAELPTSLLLERDLLSLELAVLDTCRPMVRLSKEAEKPVVSKVKKTNPHPLPNPSPKLGQAHRETLEFIKNKERVQNLEVFSHFAHISRRTMKRKLSELIKANAIKRSTEGRKVFYLPV